MDDAPPTPGPRSRLAPDREAEVFDAVLAELAHEGFDRLTLDAVAERARCSKATLYRHWEGKTDLVAAAIASVVTEDGPAPIPDTGSLRGDLRAWVTAHATHSMTRDSDLTLGLIRACTAHPELARVMRNVVVPSQVHAFIEAFHRAVERGEVAPSTPAAEFLGQMLSGPMILAHLFEASGPTPEMLMRYIDAVVLPALGVPLPEKNHKD